MKPLKRNSLSLLLSQLNVLQHQYLGQLDQSTEKSIRNNFDLQVLTASNGYRLPTGDLAWYQALGGQEGNTYPDRVYYGTEYIAQSKGLGQGPVEHGCYFPLEMHLPGDLQESIQLFLVSCTI